MAETNRGKLKLYIGYAAGVGKTYKMLEEAQLLKSQGIDVVVGYFEPHGRKETIAKTEGLEIIPRAKIPYRGSVFEEMDVGAILVRHPQICLVDEFAHTNVPGSPRAKRWEDIEIIRNAGIDVLTTMNVQHLESLNDQVWQISGIRVRETIPDWVVQQADEVVIIDLSPRALLHRLERGVIYDREKVERALQNFFRESTLAALRELALRETAHEIEHRAIKDEVEIAAKPSEQKQTKDHRILLLVTTDPNTAMLIRRAKRVADFLEAECFAVAIHTSNDLNRMAYQDREAIERHLNFARNMRIETRVLAGSDTAKTLIDFAHTNQITQVFLARNRKQSYSLFWHEGLLQKIVRLARDMQVVIVSEREPETE
ncbi:MAG TPA: histidine kinase [Acidobacteriota bacterium]|nr:histidine kinase [Acidobacteriota bacterium]